MEPTEFEKQCYLKGYREGFQAASTVIWAHAEELLISVGNEDKDKVREFIQKVKS